MIGFYNYSVILTYMSLISAVIGITFAVSGNILVALICLLFSGFCDLFDGRVARAMKNRTDDMKSFGIQIDSLCDLVAFTVLPATIGFCLGGNRILVTFAACLIVLCGVIRLAFFNVLEINRQHENTGDPTIYHGLPVTSTAILVPAFYCLKPLLGTHFPTCYHIYLIIIAILFITNFSFKKPNKKAFVYSQVVIGIILAIAVILIYVL